MTTFREGNIEYRFDADWKFDLSKLQQKLKQLVKVVDPHPMVAEFDTAERQLPWSAASV